MKTVEFYFDFGSPASYLAGKVLPRIAEAADARIIWRPMLLGGVFKATGNASPAMVPAKGRHMMIDLDRFAARYEVDFRLNSNFPINTLSLMRGAAGLQGDKKLRPYIEMVFDAIWVADRNLNDPEVVGEVLMENGFDADEFLQLISTPEVKERLKSDTEDAVARGIFGAPSMFIGDDMYFGQDRLQFVAEALGVNLGEICPKYFPS